MQTPISAVDFFTARLTHQTDPADLAAARAAGTSALVLDVRSAAAWSQGRIPGAVHLPGDRLLAGIGELVADLHTAVVVYCWGPGCNGSTRAALALASAGHTRVQELIGGFEYWVREGLAVATDAGRTRRAPDELVAPVAPAAAHRGAGGPLATLGG
ncbi:rhodanese-like domain-containing protein [Kineococcus rubinsiae]|uniref:rhodanese-like domain-containing protein n=1 Tax=Kineococcus rubinsiae TaxID=2609562 RepID=UPI0014314FA6|nr:rhodanese-like domain-containing protein [Kineococcus rubinsiae]NIZ92741.1 sulfurtransferase [Kineococcus rubinsiae]